jgi:hypothetical protein
MTMLDHAENELMVDILGHGSYDNLDEPIPWSNRSDVMMGLTIAFLVGGYYI